MESTFGYDGEQPGSRLEILLEASGIVGTWEWDHVRHTVTYDHGGAAHLTGDRSRAGQPLRGHEAMTTVHRDDYDQMIEHSVRESQKGGIIISEYRVVLPDKGVRWILSRGRTYLDADHNPIRSHGILIDITDTHGDGRTYVMRTDVEAHDPVHAAADYLLAAREALVAASGLRVTALLDMVLMEVGRLIAGRIKRDRSGQN